MVVTALTVVVVMESRAAWTTSTSAGTKDASMSTQLFLAAFCPVVAAVGTVKSRRLVRFA